MMDRGKIDATWRYAMPLKGTIIYFFDKDVTLTGVFPAR
jgi:hypothetical protein